MAKVVNEKDLLVAVVDDHIYAVTSITYYLETKGFRTAFAYSVEDALKLCKEKKPDVLVMDAKIIGMDENKMPKQFDGQKVILMSANGAAERLIGKFDKGIGTIKKPVDPEELVQMIRKKFGIPKKR